MNWLWVTIGIALIGGIIGFLVSNDGERGSGFLSGFVGAGLGCGTIIVRISFFVIVLLLLVRIVIWLFS